MMHPPRQHGKLRPIAPIPNDTVLHPHQLALPSSLVTELTTARYAKKNAVSPCAKSSLLPTLPTSIPPRTKSQTNGSEPPVIMADDAPVRIQLRLRAFLDSRTACLAAWRGSEESVEVGERERAETVRW